MNEASKKLLSAAEANSYLAGTLKEILERFMKGEITHDEAIEEFMDEKNSVMQHTDFLGRNNK